jgi:hypothetical protein
VDREGAEAVVEVGTEAPALSSASSRKAASSRACLSWRNQKPKIFPTVASKSVPHLERAGLAGVSKLNRRPTALNF